LKLCQVIVKKAHGVADLGQSELVVRRPTALHTVMLALDGSLASGGAEDRQPLSGGGADDELWLPPPPLCRDEEDACAGVLELPRDALFEPEALAVFEAVFEPAAEPEPPPMPVGAALEAVPTAPPVPELADPPPPPLQAATSSPTATTTAPTRHEVNLAIGLPPPPTSVNCLSRHACIRPRWRFRRSVAS
jgi:hypothetical protein